MEMFAPQWMHDWLRHRKHCLGIFGWPFLSGCSPYCSSSRPKGLLERPIAPSRNNRLRSNARGQGRERRARVEDMIRRLRLISGLVMFAYVTTHFVNHSLGLVSVQVMDFALEHIYQYWASALGGVLLYGAFATHSAWRFGRSGCAARSRCRSPKQPSSSSASRFHFSLRITSSRRALPT